MSELEVSRYFRHRIGLEADRIQTAAVLHKRARAAAQMADEPELRDG
jgi:hypothetical protein